MKPSAYISDGGILFKESPPDSLLKLTPLYAMRELTDEEIEDIADQHLTAHAEFIGAGGCHVEGDIAFARAILQKASEK